MAELLPTAVYVGQRVHPNGSSSYRTSMDRILFALFAHQHKVSATFCAQ